MKLKGSRLRRAGSSAARVRHATVAAIALVVAAALVSLGSIQPTAGAPVGPVSGSGSAAGGRSTSQIVVKFDPRLKVGLRGTAVVSRAGADLGSLRSVLTSHSATASRRFVAPEETLDETLNNYLRVDTPSPAAAVDLVARLKATPGVMDAYPAPQAVPPPASPDLTAQQANYTSGSPRGIGSGVTDLYGIHGSGVSIYDLEYSWNRNHEDLTDLLAAASKIDNGTPHDPFNDLNHGTAVIGELDANRNSFGTTGLAYSASIHTINVDDAERGYDLGNAITLATSLGQPGDVILLEQQQIDADGNFVPVEYYSEYYDAIRAATAKGLVVIEPAGNGGQNLDDPKYGSTFPFDQPDSGAIIVGAGAPAGCSSASGTPEHGALALSNYGERVNVQGLGACVTTTGYGTAFANGTNANADYTTTFNGTSSASPIVAASAALIVQWGRENHLSAPAPNTTLKPAEVRRLLMLTGTPQAAGDPKHIGPLPDLANAFARLLPSAGTVPKQTVASGTQFTLKAPNAAAGALGGPLTYQWTKTSGPAVTIAHPTSQTTTVTGVSGATSLGFKVQVTDPRRQTATSSTTVMVASASTLVANAGVNFSVVSHNSAITIPLSSSGSGPGSLTYRWTLLNSTDGKGSSIKNPTAANTTTNSFTPSGTQSYTYRLTVTSGTRTATDDVVVSIRPK